MTRRRQINTEWHDNGLLMVKAIALILVFLSFGSTPTTTTFAFTGKVSSLFGQQQNQQGKQKEETSCSMWRNQISKKDKVWGVIRNRIVDNNKTRHDNKLSASASDDTGSPSGPLGIIIAGAPASGKGTQCENIKKDFGVVHLSTGDMLRAAVEAGTDVGKAAKEYMDSGKLVPDEVIIGVVKERLDSEDCREKGWLLDGFPRTAAQAEALEEAGIQADCFLFLDVPDELLVERVVGRRTDPVTGKIYHMTYSPPDDDEVLGRLTQRSDDTEEKVKVRLEQFHTNVDAVKNSFDDVSVTIDGTQQPNEVASAISAALKEKCAIKL